MELRAGMDIFFYVVVFVFGLAVGSFLNVVIWRWPRKESIIQPGSHCPKCGSPIAWYDNIPVLSFILLKGKCRHCKEKISFRYPLIELLAGLLSVLAFWLFGFSRWYFIYYAFLASLFAASIIDIEHRLIPDEISVGGMVVGIGLSFLPERRIPVFDSLLGAIAGFLILFIVAELYYLITRREGMGLGDAKLLAMIGAFLGLRSLPLVIFAGSMLGTIIGIFFLFLSKEGRFYKIPFGPFLSVGSLVYLVISTGNIRVQLGAFNWILGI
jgi:leader peptidase (prepilin peptidase)/N-methyltransferase